jgi:dUTP pyrophosphatase
MEKIEVLFSKYVDWAKIPDYDTKGAAGCDISVALQDEIVLYPHEVKSLPTGFALRFRTDMKRRSAAGQEWHAKASW